MMQSQPSPDLKKAKASKQVSNMYLSQNLKKKKRRLLVKIRLIRKKLRMFPLIMMKVTQREIRKRRRMRRKTRAVMME